MDWLKAGNELYTFVSNATYQQIYAASFIYFLKFAPFLFRLLFFVVG